MANYNDIVAIGLLTEDDVRRLGRNFSRLFPLPLDGEFDDLIKAIDDADRKRSVDPEE